MNGQPVVNGRTLRNVYLVGPMGCGKTTLGRRVAGELGLDFIDCDQEIERQTGVTVNLIFDIEGESGFRMRETELLQRLAEQDGFLVATGGGAILREENRDLMANSGLVVWLRATVDQQLERLGRDRTRPLLQTPDREQRLRQLAQERDPLYAGIADLVFDASHRNVRRVAARLAQAVREQWPQSAGEKQHASG